MNLQLQDEVQFSFTGRITRQEIIDGKLAFYITDAAGLVYVFNTDYFHSVKKLNSHPNLASIDAGIKN